MSGAALAALDYARRGWRVFPCHSPIAGSCSCGAGGSCASPAKHPRTRHGLHDASADPSDVKRWWARWPGANVGLRTGGGLVVLDVDPAHGGTESLAALEDVIGVLPATMTVRTGGGGLHLYFSHHGPVRNSAGSLGPGLDVRGDGGYVIAPPSWHVAGVPYRLGAGGPLVPLPARLLERLHPPPPPRPVVDPSTIRPGPHLSAWAAAALAGEVDRVAAAPVGQRNHTLNRSAFVLGQIVGAGHLGAAEVTALLGRAGEASGLGAPEVAATVASGLAAGQRWPRHPRERPAPTTGRPGRARLEQAPSLADFVDECARRLQGDDGAGVRRWLAGLGFDPVVLALNQVGADPGAHRQRRPVGMPAAGPAVVLPTIDAGRVAYAQLRPLHPASAGRLLASAGAAAPPMALVRPVSEAGPCVVVTAGMLDALAAGSAGYRAVALLAPASSARSGIGEDVVERLAAFGVPFVVALDPEPAAALHGVLRRRGLRAALISKPSGGDLTGWMAHSRTWADELAGALRVAWTCEHRSRRLVR